MAERLRSHPLSAIPLAAEVSKETLALIAGGAAILGSVTGTLVAGFFTLRGEDKRHAFAKQMRDADERRQTQRELQLAKGAAREMRATLRSNRDRMQFALDHKDWWHGEEPLRARLRTSKSASFLLRS